MSCRYKNCGIYQKYVTFIKILYIIKRAGYLRITEMFTIKYAYDKDVL